MGPFPHNNQGARKGLTKKVKIGVVPLIRVVKGPPNPDYDPAIGISAVALHKGESACSYTVFSGSLANSLQLYFFNILPLL